MAEPKPKRASDEMPDGWQDWPTLGEAANLSGISRARLTTYIKNGTLKKWVAPNSKGAVGTYRINPEDLEALEAAVAEEEEAKAAPTTADVVRASVEGLKQAQQHAERLITLFEQPYRHVTNALREENDALRKELETMRTERAKFETEREAARQGQALIGLEVAEQAAKQETKKQALEMAKPLVASFMQKHLGIAVDPRMLKLKQAVETIPRDSFAVLFKMGVLPPEAEALLKEGLDWKDEPEQAPPVANGAAS